MTAREPQLQLASGLLIPTWLQAPVIGPRGRALADCCVMKNSGPDLHMLNLVVDDMRASLDFYQDQRNALAGRERHGIWNTTSSPNGLRVKAMPGDRLVMAGRVLAVGGCCNGHAWLTGRRCAPRTGSMAHRAGSSRTNGTSAQLGGLALCRTEVR
jgi:hypothetical protein